MNKAIALYRVSTHRQSVEGHSLEAQEERVRKAADFWDATIEQEWRLDTSSRVGKNLGRKDLAEAIEYCKQHRVKFFIIDEVDRFMRSIDEYYWYKVEFAKLGVQLIFASQPELKEQDQFGKLREMLAIYEAEASNAERSRKTLDKMKARVLAGYYPFYPHQGYRKTEAKDGLHIPDEPRFTLLQNALRAIAAGEMTPKEAQVWLRSKGYTTPKGNKVLDMNRFHEILVNPYYAGIIHVPSWEIEATGLHQPMITREEHAAIVKAVTGRVVRAKKQFNPDFPLSLAIHEPCSHNEGKLTGLLHSNGKGWERKEYRCRTCKKAVPQEAVHQSLDETLEQLKPSQEGLEQLREALSTVWRQKEAFRVERIAQLRQRMAHIEDKKGRLIVSLSEHPDLAEDIRTAIEKTKEEALYVEQEIDAVSSVDAEFLEFVEYALSYTENLRSKWWTLPPESLMECKQLLFRNTFSVDESAKVYTPNISTIYSLLKTKPSTKAGQNVEMVELAGSAPASASLSWLIFYRHSPFSCLRQ